MKIAIAKSKWFMSSHNRAFQMLANHVASHYPKDAKLHQLLRGSFKTSADACARIEKSFKSGSRKTKSSVSRTNKRRTVARRRPTARGLTAKRRTTARRTRKTRRAA